jgi:hypothetical protein
MIGQSHKSPGWRWALVLCLTLGGAGVQVPEQDLADGRATPMPGTNPGAEGYPPMRILASDEYPQNAYAAAHYRGHWFWIDDRDLRSKRAFMFLLIFSSLSETGAVPQVPVVTIPTR